MIAILAIRNALRCLSLALWLYAVVTIGYPLFPASAQPLMSMPRFVIVAFPIFMATGLHSKQRPPGHRAIRAIFIVSLVPLTTKFATFSWVA